MHSEICIISDGWKKPMRFAYRNLNGNTIGNDSRVSANEI